MKNYALLIVLFFAALIFACQQKQTDPQQKVEVKTDSIPADKPIIHLKDLIVVTSPSLNKDISSPINITGKAVGNWFFEASFPIKLVNEDGSTLLENYIMADGKWMTESFVPFSKTISFPQPAKTTNGTLILYKANPSGMPEHADSLVIPLQFIGKD